MTHDTINISNYIHFLSVGSFSFIRSTRL